MDLKAKLKISSSWTTFIFGDFEVVMQILEKLARKEGKVLSYSTSSSSSMARNCFAGAAATLLAVSSAWSRRYSPG
jgi:hypothetical protein